MEKLCEEFKSFQAGILESYKDLPVETSVDFKRFASALGIDPNGKDSLQVASEQGWSSRANREFNPKVDMIGKNLTR